MDRPRYDRVSYLQPMHFTIGTALTNNTMLAVGLSVTESMMRIVTSLQENSIWLLLPFIKG